MWAFRFRVCYRKRGFAEGLSRSTCRCPPSQVGSLCLKLRVYGSKLSIESIKPSRASGNGGCRSAPATIASFGLALRAEATWAIMNKRAAAKEFRLIYRDRETLLKGTHG